MKYQKLEFFVGKPRLDRYLRAAGYSKSKAQKLYRINIRVGQAFYPLLHLLETFLRNAVNNNISVYFNTPDWIISERYRFMSDASLARTHFFLRNAVQKAELTIIRRGETITPGKIIAEQSFAFWASLFDPHHYRLIGGVTIHCFPDKPAPVNRNIIAQKLSLIRKFRNRLYHNEPICFANDCINFHHAQQIRQHIYDLITWMDIDLNRYIDYFDSIDIHIEHANRL